MFNSTSASEDDGASEDDENAFIDVGTNTNFGSDEKNDKNEIPIRSDDSAYNSIIIGNDDCAYNSIIIGSDDIACSRNKIIVGTAKRTGIDDKIIGTYSSGKPIDVENKDITGTDDFN